MQSRALPSFSSSGWFAAFALIVLGSRGSAAIVAADDGPKADAAAAAKNELDLPPFPADANVKQTTHVAGKALDYTVTVGSLLVRDEKARKIGEVVFTSYVLGDGSDVARPVTFAFNGGPGAASVYLNLGAMGPKRLQFGAAGDGPSDTPRLEDNPGTWLDLTDLVFIDPIGTGFSRARVPMEEARGHFFTTTGDIEYLSRIVYDWLLKFGRLMSPKFVVGESYGGFRAPRITRFLQTELGVGVNGVVMVSPYLEPAMGESPDFSPMPWIVNLPSMAAAHFERQGKPLTTQQMAEVETYARGEFVSDLLKGRRDAAAVSRIVDRIVAYTGLERTVVAQSGGRVEDGLYLRGIEREKGRVGSVYDANVTAEDPFPWSARRRSGDPILDAIIAPTTSAMVDFVTRVVGWKVEGRYYALSSEVGRNWERSSELQNSVTDLRQAVATDPKMRVLIVHGYNDLACPYFASVLIVDQMAIPGDASRVRVREYPGGHMFYSRPESLAALRADAIELYSQR